MHKLALLLSFLILFLAFIPNAAAQSAQSGNFSIRVDSSQVNAWLGREAQIRHPANPAWHERDNATLHFYFSNDYGQRAESVIKTAEKAREKTLRFLPPETVSDVHIYLLGNINQYFEALQSPGRAPDWAAGLTILRDNVILIRLAPRGAARVEPEKTLAHELNHVALSRYAGENAFPHWFYEGLAMFVTGDWDLTRAETMARAAMAGRLLDLDGIDDGFKKTGAAVDLAYAQSAHFFSWLVKEYGEDTMKQLMAQTARGTPFNDAFIQNFGRSPKAAFALWHKNVSREESLLASFFSHDGLFFFISLFAAVGLCIALWRKSAIRKRRLEAMDQEIPVSSLPKNLQSFGPFQHK